MQYVVMSGKEEKLLHTIAMIHMTVNKAAMMFINSPLIDYPRLLNELKQVAPTLKHDEMIKPFFANIL